MKIENVWIFETFVALKIINNKTFNHNAEKLVLDFVFFVNQIQFEQSHEN